MSPVVEATVVAVVGLVRVLMKRARVGRERLLISRQGAIIH